MTNKAQIETKSKHIFEASDTVKIGKGRLDPEQVQLSSSSKGLANMEYLCHQRGRRKRSFTLVETLPDDAVNDQAARHQLNTHYAYRRRAG